MQSSSEYQGEKRMPSSVINAKKQREKNRMGKSRDLFKKIRDTKETFHAKMGGIKDSNLTEAEDIKKRWQEYTEELYKKGLNDLDNHDDVVIHLEPDILVCEVKWALGRIKDSGGDEIPAELFQILKDDAVKYCTQFVSKFGKLSSGHMTGKDEFSFQSQRRVKSENVQTLYLCAHFIS